MPTAVVHKHRRARLVLDPGKTHIPAMLAVHGCRYSIPMRSYQSIPVDPVYESCIVLGIDPGRPCRPISILASIYLILILAYIYGLIEIKADGGGFLLTDWWGKGNLILRIDIELTS